MDGAEQIRLDVYFNYNKSDYLYYEWDYSIDLIFMMLVNCSINNEYDSNVFIHALR